MSKDSSDTSSLAKSLALACVRNTCLEHLHAGRLPDTIAGDYSDVKVVTSYGEIPWNNLSRISNAEMKLLMQEVVNKLYTFLSYQHDADFLEALHRLAAPYVQTWDDPELLQDFVTRKADVGHAENG